MSCLIAGRGESVRNSFWGRNAIRISEEIVDARRKILDVSGSARCVRYVFTPAQKRSRKKSNAPTIERGYLGNHYFFRRDHHPAPVSWRNIEDGQCRTTNLKSAIPAMES